MSCVLRNSFFKHTPTERITQEKICSAKSTENIFIIAWDGERIRVLDVIVKMIQISWILQFQQQICRHYFVRKAPGQKYYQDNYYCNDEYNWWVSLPRVVSPTFCIQINSDSKLGLEFYISRFNSWNKVPATNLFSNISISNFQLP